MGVKYIWDTNIVIYFLQNQFPPTLEYKIEAQLEEGIPCISAITEIELLCWRTEDNNDLKTLRNFINDALIIDLDKPVKYKTAEIRKKYKIKLPDAIIAATAVVYNLTLVTRNERDFKDIDEIKILNPWKYI